MASCNDSTISNSEPPPLLAHPIHIDLHTHVRTYAHTHARTHIRTHARTHTRTHTHIRTLFIDISLSHLPNINIIPLTHTYTLHFNLHIPILPFPSPLKKNQPPITECLIGTHRMTIIYMKPLV